MPRERKPVTKFNPDVDGANDTKRLGKEKPKKRARSTPPTTASGKKVKPQASSSSSVKNAGSSAVQKQSIGANVKKSAFAYDTMLTEYIEDLAEMVDADWHDGYEEQGEQCCEWYAALRAPLQDVLDTGVGKKQALEQCNEILRAVAGSYQNLLSCGMRGGSDAIGDAHCPFKLNTPWGKFQLSPDETGVTSTWGCVWIALLRTHANDASTDRSLLFQCIKDASDHGVVLDEGEDDSFLGLDKEGAPTRHALDGRIAKKEKWKSLKNNAKTYHDRPVIDRRFDGSPDRRTRDYYSDSDEYFGFW